MSHITIIYESDYGNTQKMAEAIAEGAKSVPGTTVSLKQAEKVTADDMMKSDGVIIGTPVQMGSMDHRVKTFIDTVCGGLWMGNKMVGKVGAVFVTGSGYGGGGAELTLLSLLNNLAELGMVIVPLPKNTNGYEYGGLQWGPPTADPPGFIWNRTASRMKASQRPGIMAPMWPELRPP